jgi:ABC-type glycerol-3-phosphate transport system substrate-binding protein
VRKKKQKKNKKIYSKARKREKNKKNKMKMKIAMMTMIMTNILLIVVFLCHLVKSDSDNTRFTVIDAQVCYTTGSCSIDPFTKQLAPLNVIGNVYASTANADWINIDKPAHLRWTRENNVSVIYHRIDPERIRFSQPQLYYSSQIDVGKWQSIEPIQDNVKDLTDLATKNNWINRYPPRLLEKTVVDGRIMGIADKFKFWGIWYPVQLFKDLNITIIEPVTFDRLIEICDRLLLNGIVPIGLGSADNWQGMTWWEMVALRLGGVEWYNKMTLSSNQQNGDDNSFGINFATDEIHLKTWDIMDRLKKYFPQPLNQTANYAQLDVYKKFVKKEWAMILSTSTTATVPSQLSSTLKNNDFDFFYFPQINDSLPLNDTGEFSSFTVIVINKDAQQPDVASKYIEWITSDEYNSQFVNYTAGAAFALKSLRNLITDPTLKRGFDHLDNENEVPNILNMIDTGNMATWANAMKPTWYNYFTGQITKEVVINKMEQLRVEIILQSVSVPIINRDRLLSDKIISISCLTDNATIYYSAVIFSTIGAGTSGGGGGQSQQSVEDVYTLYTQQIIVFDNSNYRFRAYARKPLMKDSEIVEFTFTTTTSSPYQKGDSMKHELSALSILIFLLILIASLIFFLAVDHANRQKEYKFFWSMFGSIPFSGLNATLMIISFYLMEWELTITFDTRYIATGVFLYIFTECLGNYLFIRYNRDINFNSRLPNKNSSSISIKSAGSSGNRHNENLNFHLTTTTTEKKYLNDSLPQQTHGNVNMIIIDPVKASKRKRLQLLISISFIWSFGLCAMQTLFWSGAEMLNCAMTMNYMVIFGEFLFLWVVSAAIIYSYIKLLSSSTHPSFRIGTFCGLQLVRFFLTSELHIVAVKFIYQDLNYNSVENHSKQRTIYQFFVVAGIICGCLICIDVVLMLITLKETVINSDWTISQQHKMINRYKKDLEEMTHKYKNSQLYYSRMLTLAPFCDHNQLKSYIFKNLQYINYSGNNGKDKDNNNSQNSQLSSGNNNGHNNNNNNNNNSINLTDSPKMNSMLSNVSQNGPNSPPSSKLGLLGFEGEEKIDWALMNMNNLPNIPIDDLLDDDYACYILMTYASIKKKEEMCFIMHYKHLNVQINLNISSSWEIDQYIQSIFKMFILDDAKLKLNLSATSKLVMQQRFFKAHTRQEFLVILKDIYELTKHQLIISNFITELNSPMGGDNGRFWLKAANQFVFVHQKKMKTQLPQQSVNNGVPPSPPPQRIILGSIDHINNNLNVLIE